MNSSRETTTFLAPSSRTQGQWWSLMDLSGLPWNNISPTKWFDLMFFAQCESTRLGINVMILALWWTPFSCDGGMVDSQGKLSCPTLCWIWRVTKKWQLDKYSRILAKVMNSSLEKLKPISAGMPSKHVYVNAYINVSIYIQKQTYTVDRVYTVYPYQYKQLHVTVGYLTRNPSPCLLNRFWFAFWCSTIYTHLVIPVIPTKAPSSHHPTYPKAPDPCYGNTRPF